MKPEKYQQLTRNEIEKLLSQQTAVILTAVDEKVTNLERRMDKMEVGINQKFDRLLTTLDKFLKRVTNIEDEFEMMKADINRVKKVIREKLGVDL